MKKSRSAIIVLFSISLIVLIYACRPSSQRIMSDFNDVFARMAGKNLEPSIISSGPGEGDSDNVYMHVKFDVVATADVQITTGWFAGHALKRGQRLAGLELVMLYQRDKKSGWKMTWFELKKTQ